MRESRLYTPIIMRATELGLRLFRNQCGAHKTERGQWVRYGVANPGGSDLLGVTPVVVTSSMVGLTLGVLVAVEVKPDRSSKLSRHQRAFLDFVRRMGGIAIKATSAEDFSIQISQVLHDVAAGKQQRE